MARITSSKLCVLVCLLHLIQAQLTDIQLQTFRDGDVTVTDDPDDEDKYWIFRHPGIPSHDYGKSDDKIINNQNTVSVQNHEFRIPKSPEISAVPECLKLGTIAATVIGIPIFNPYSELGYNAVEGEYAEVFDTCNGHPEPQGAYHYHQIPNCLFQPIDDQLIAVALDGYPVLGPLHNGRNLTAVDLDDCHGWINNLTNKYEYRITYDFPYVIGCFRGVSTVQGIGPVRRKRQGPHPPPGTDGGDGNFTPESCLYVKFCENPAFGCPDSAYVFGGSVASVDNEDEDGDYDDGDNDDSDNDGGDNDDGDNNDGDKDDGDNDDGDNDGGDNNDGDNDDGDNDDGDNDGADKNDGDNDDEDKVDGGTIYDDSDNEGNSSERMLCRATLVCFLLFYSCFNQ